MLSVEEDRELLPLGHMFGHQAEDAFITIGQQVRAPQLRQARDQGHRRQCREVQDGAGFRAAWDRGRGGWSASAVPRNRPGGTSISHGGHEHAASADGDGGGHAGGCDRIAGRRHRVALVVARRGARQRRHGGAQHRQSRAQARGGIRGRAVQAGQAAAGRRRRVLPAGAARDRARSSRRIRAWRWWAARAKCHSSSARMRSSCCAARIRSSSRHR